MITELVEPRWQEAVRDGCLKGTYKAEAEEAIAGFLFLVGKPMARIAGHCVKPH